MSKAAATVEPEATPDVIDTVATEHVEGDEHEIEQHPVVEPEPEAVPDVEPPAPVTGPPALPAPAQQRGLIAGGELTIVPAVNELDLMAQMAVSISAADTAPRALRGKPNDVFMILLTARDLNVSLTTSLREFHVIDGRVTLSPKVKLAMVRQKGIGKIWPDPNNNDESATWYATRHDLPAIEFSSTYTKADAERAKLWTKDNWKAYPARMLSWRACGYLLDDTFSEVGTGLYSPDELGAVTDEDGEPVIDVIAHAQPLRGTKAPAAHERKQQTAAAPVALDAERRAALKARIDALAAVHADAKQALVDLWTADDGTGKRRLPTLDTLEAEQYVIADAVVKSIEARVAKGEWGTTSPADPAGVDTAPDTAASVSDAAASESGASDSTSDDQPGSTLTIEQTAEIKAEVEEFVNGLRGEALTEQLRSSELPLSGSVKDRRMRLAEKLMREEVELAERKAEQAALPLDGDQR